MVTTRQSDEYEGDGQEVKTERPYREPFSPNNHVARIRSADMMPRLNSLLDEYIEDKEVRQDALEALDLHGIHSNLTLKMVGDMQKAHKVKAGFYRKLIELAADTDKSIAKHDRARKKKD